MIWLRIALLPALAVIAFLARDNVYMLSIVSAAFGVAITEAYNQISRIDRQLLWSVIKAVTVYARSPLRISVAYLVCVVVDDEYLLIRGSRIRTQFQPVGGVYKCRLSKDELFRRFGAKEDIRFERDNRNEGDLRIILPGKNLPKFLHWFNKGRQREVLPGREFHEELVASQYLSSEAFPFIDCIRLSRRSLPLSFDRSIGMQQLIMADIWMLEPTHVQLEELRRLRDRKPRPRSLLFAKRTEIETGAKAGKVTTADIARTALWLLQDSTR